MDGLIWLYGAPLRYSLGTIATGLRYQVALCPGSVGVAATDRDLSSAHLRRCHELVAVDLSDPFSPEIQGIHCRDELFQWPSVSDVLGLTVHGARRLISVRV